MSSENGFDREVFEHQSLAALACHAADLGRRKLLREQRLGRHWRPDDAGTGASGDRHGVGHVIEVAVA